MSKIIKEGEEIQPRARVYLDHIDSNVFNGVDYIGWIMKGSAHYKKKIGHDYIIDQDDFTEFLKEFPVEGAEFP
ncbi:MAG: hypothetical protein AWU54_443 [Candidatus Frackibacter sp. T328-2]|nr:MAG: hypothetical protein AWU54_443 [Candidatus Frackibacter sp. T328-2]